jgi:hypothetical protein
MVFEVLFAPVRMEGQIMLAGMVLRFGTKSKLAAV